MFLTPADTHPLWPKGWIKADWSVSDSVIALVTTRQGGCSHAPYNSLNLGLHVGDDPQAVACNRARLKQALPDGVVLQWLEQVHGTAVVDAGSDGVVRRGDAVFCERAGVGGVIMTADCLPVFFATQDGQQLALAHAGWRGLLEGVLENTVSRFTAAPDRLHVWFGPAIGPCHFEVGEEVRSLFLARASHEQDRQRIAEVGFYPAATPGKYLADLYTLARLRLERAGVGAISGGGQCTVCNQSDFFSYRRDGVTGRFASLILRKP